MAFVAFLFLSYFGLACAEKITDSLMDKNEEKKKCCNARELDDRNSIIYIMYIFTSKFNRNR